MLVTLLLGWGYSTSQSLGRKTSLIATLHLDLLFIRVWYLSSKAGA